MSGIPRWVRIVGIATIVTALLLIASALLGDHGPGRHTGAGDRIPSAAHTATGGRSR